MKDKKINKTDVTHSGETGEIRVASGRRKFVKGAAGALPAILTLQSGAALARSSNLMVTATPGDATDRRGRTLCLDKRSVRNAGGGVFDLGDPAHGRVFAINDRRHFAYDRNSGIREVTETEMCENGGQYFYRRRWGWRQVNVRKGVLISATALSSIASRIDIIDC